jgi:hypothetical protein
MGAQSGSAKLSMAQSRSSIETYHVSTLERPELRTKTAEPWWPLQFADVLSTSISSSGIGSSGPAVPVPLRVSTMLKGFYRTALLGKAI